jgi:prepilin-type processing-associated H-X9-DG protein
MSGTDSDSQEGQAGEGARKEKGVRRRRFTKTGLLAFAVVVTLSAAVLVGVYICQSRRPSGVGAAVRRFVDGCLVSLGIRQRRASGMPFGTNLSGLAKALLVYSDDHPQLRLPSGDKWCDVLIQNDFTTLKQFVHRRSDSIEGESDAAMNVNATGKRLSELPADMVLLFVTDLGKGRGRRGGLMKDRGFYKVAPCADPNIKVYKKRWNQVGGPEILTTRYNDGQGCNVAFVDTHVKFVKAGDLAKLKWKPDQNEK